LGTFQGEKGKELDGSSFYGQFPCHKAYLHLLACFLGQINKQEKADQFGAILFVLCVILLLKIGITFLHLLILKGNLAANSSTQWHYRDS
jgi:hypothetical protein